MGDGARDALPGRVEEFKRRSLLADLTIRLIREKPLGSVGGVIVLTLFLVGVFADFLAPYPMAEIHLRDALQAPSAKYLLGTDEFGRDVLSRVIAGARISMIVGLAGTSLATLVSTIIGVLSGFVGGKFDLLVQRFVDAFLCLPGLFIVLTVMAVLGPGVWQVIIVLGVRFGIAMSRVMRGAVIGIKENVYVEAGRAIGCTTWELIIRHILPNVMAPIIVLFTVRMSNIILMEATISFLGFGIPPPIPSWGSMISGSGRKYMLQAPWVITWPGLALSIVVYGINMFGDALRDLLDPRLRGGTGRYGKVNVKVKRSF
ncbi:ABC transporter permease [Chloroflexota bacterium]